MSQSERNKVRYTLPRPSSSPSKYLDTKESADPYWKYLQRHCSASPTRNYRRHHSPTPEPSENYYASANTCRPYKHYNCPNPSQTRYVSTENPEVLRQYAQQSRQQCRIHPKNIAIIRRTRYKDDLEDEESLKYMEEELGNFTEENADEDAADEADEDQDETADSVDKDYDERETGEEGGEESDVYPEYYRSRRQSKKETLQPVKSQHRSVERHPEDSRKHRYDVHVHKEYQMHPPKGRYYRDVISREIPEVLSEENVASSTGKGTSRKCPVNFHKYALPNSVDKYRVTTSPTREIKPTRARQEIESLEAESILRCSQCGTLSIRRQPHNRKNNCRFQDQINFPVKGPTGDEVEISGNGHYNLKYSSEDTAGVCSSKPRRTKVRSPICEGAEGRHVGNDISSDHLKSKHSKDMSNVSHERTKHSVQTVHNPARISSHYNN